MRWIKTLSPIGLDVGARQVKAVQLSQGPRQTRLLAATALPRLEPDTPLGADEAKSLMGALGRQGFVGQNIVLGVPHESVVSAMIDLPPAAPGLPVDRVAHVEFARVNRMDSADFEMAYWPLPQSSRATDHQAMAVGCLHEHANARIELFEQVGAHVHALDTTANALARAISPLIADPNDITAMIDIGWSGAQIIVLHQGMMIYSRLHSDMGLEGVHTLLRRRGDFDADVADWLIDTVGLGASHAPELDEHQRASATEVGAVLTIYAENLANQALAAINYAEHRYPDANNVSLFVSGGGANTPGLGEHLRASLDMNVNIASPHQLATVHRNTSLGTVSPLTLGAFGLARYEDPVS